MKTILNILAFLALAVVSSNACSNPDILRRHLQTKARDLQTDDAELEELKKLVEEECPKQDGLIFYLTMDCGIQSLEDFPLCAPNDCTASEVEKLLEEALVAGVTDDAALEMIQSCDIDVESSAPLAVVSSPPSNACSIISDTIRRHLQTKARDLQTDAGLEELKKLVEEECPKQDGLVFYLTLDCGGTNEDDFPEDYPFCATNDCTASEVEKLLEETLVEGVTDDAFLEQLQSCNIYVESSAPMHFGLVHHIAGAVLAIVAMTLM